jgi:hypothetical protein
MTTIREELEAAWTGAQLDMSPEGVEALYAPVVRALLQVEWEGEATDCPSCGAHECYGEHAATCTIDAALTAVGYPDQASRDKARGELPK